jgi:transposase InsO family protein
MAADVANTVRNCHACARNRIKERNKTSYLKLFPASSPLEYVSIDLLGPLPKTAHGNRFLLVMTDRFSKLTRTVPLRSTTAYVVAKVFCDHWVFTYGPPRHVLTDNGPQFAAKFLLAICRELGMENVFSSAYDPKTNGQVERFNRTILNALRGYLAGCPTEWDEYTAALTFGYNSHIHTSLGLAPFELVLSRPPPTMTMEMPEIGNGDSPTTLKSRFLSQLKELIPGARQQLASAQQRYKRVYDRLVRPKNDALTEGSWVYTRKEVHDTGVNPKLDEQTEGPFQVISNDEHTLPLRIGDTMVRVSSDRVTPAPVPRSSLEETHTEDVTESSDLPETPVPADPSDEGKPEEPEVMPTNGDEPEYVLEKILGARQLPDGSLRYRVRWYGYSRLDET